MVLVDARDTGRQHPERWTATAMRATRSGVHDLTGIKVAAADLIGPPGALSTEPWFEGGIWRYAAAHVGGAEALVQATLDLLAASGRAGDPHQAARLGRALALTDSARRMVDACAVLVETADPSDHAATDRAVSHALLTRALVEDACVEVLALALDERAGGGEEAQSSVRAGHLRRAEPRALIAQAGMLLVDANLPSGAIGALCDATDAPIVALAVSPAKAPRIAPHAARFALAFMNRREMNALISAPLGEPVTPATLARLSALGFRRAVISDGGGPVTVLDGDAAWRQPVGEAANPVDVTGAGDALAGATLAHWPGMALPSAVRVGVAAAAATIGVTGPFRADIAACGLKGRADALPAREPIALDTDTSSETP